jgi:TRAP-type mannitol/chloroaromatic compound transport system substrate-binding protein
MNAWVYQGGGNDLLNEFYKKLQHPPPAGRQHRRADGRLVPQGDQDVDDLKGLKMRIGGFAGRVMSEARRRAAADRRRRHLPALEKGTIDAVEWVGPYDDEKLGFNKVAKYYYYAGLVGRLRHALADDQHRGAGTSCRRIISPSSKPPPPRRPTG